MLVLVLILLFSVGRIPNHSGNFSLAVPSAPPADTSNVIDRSFLGFAFEQASFYNYSFNPDGTPNVFSQNLINSVLGRTGGTPILRVGGTSGDKGHYDATQTFPLSRPATDGKGPAFRKPFLSVGPSYFEAFKNFPQAQFIFMVPLLHRNLTNSLEWARQGLAAIGDRLEALEIGNEPDLYQWFNVSSYVKEYVQFQKALSAEFPDQLGSGPKFQALDGVWRKQLSVGKLTINATMEAGINETGAIKQMAYHLYQAPHEGQTDINWLQRHIANHTAIVANMARFEPEIQYLHAHSPGARFVLSENGNSLGRQHMMQRNNLATAIWNVDYQLRAMVIGVDRVNNQQIVYPGYQMWNPVECGSGPITVRPNYYSQPFLADFIGSSGQTRVSEIKIPGQDFVSAYVAYEDDSPVRIAVVNLYLWTPEDHNGVRPSINVALNGLWEGIKAAQIHKLGSPEGAYGTDFVTWRGLRWSPASNGSEVRIGRDAILVAARAGTVNVQVEATSAVIVELQSNWNVGSDAVKDMHVVAE